MIRQLREDGIRLSRNGDRLHVEARRGALTDDVRAFLVDHKAELLAALDYKPTTPIREELERIANAEGIDAAVVLALAEADLATCDGAQHDVLTAYVRAIRNSDLRERGQVPPDETARAQCAGCGPVWVAPEVGAVAPSVAGWARLAGCPWCHIRRRGGAVPHPQPDDGGHSDMDPSD